jgi:dihydroneopterin aldolase
MRDRIVIEELELSAHIGVPDEERALPQRLTVTLTLEPAPRFDALDDEIGRTVDYFEVSRAVQAEARRRPRKLLETLAEELAGVVLRGFAVDAVEVAVRKYILPDTAGVSVQIRRTKAA